MVDIVVSVIVPVYNTEKYLPDCVDSILGQTFQSLELILVDDGSPDGSPALCDRYAEQNPRVHVIHQENRGLAAARNRGLDLASGEFVYFLDSDDSIALDAIEKLVSRADADRLDALLFDGVAVDEHGNRTGQDREFTRKEAYPGVWDGRLLFALMRKNADYNCLVQQILVRRSFLTECGLRFAAGVWHEDELFTFLLLMNCKRCGHLPDPLFFRRWRPGSIMTSPKTVRNVTGYLCIFEEMADWYTRACLAGDIDDAVRKHVISFFWNTYHPCKKLSRAGQQVNAEIKQRLFRRMKALDYLGDREVSLCCRAEWLVDFKRRVLRRIAGLRRVN